MLKACRKLSPTLMQAPLPFFSQGHSRGSLSEKCANTPPGPCHLSEQDGISRVLSGWLVLSGLAFLKPRNPLSSWLVWRIDQVSWSFLSLIKFLCNYFRNSGHNIILILTFKVFSLTLVGNAISSVLKYVTWIYVLLCRVNFSICLTCIFITFSIW